MLNRYEMKIFFQCLQFVTKVGFLEYAFMKKSVTLCHSVQITNYKGLKSYIGAITVVAYVTHFILSCARFLATDSITIKAIAGIIMVGIFAVTCFRLTLVIYTEEIVRIANNILVKELCDSSKKHGNNNKMRGRVYAFLVLTCALSVCATSIQSFIIQLHMFATTFGLIGVAVLSCFLVICTVFFISDAVAILGIFIPSLLNLVDGLQEACLDHSALDNEDRIHLYRCMQLFNQLHNTAFGTYLLPWFKASVIWALFFAVYSLIRLRQALHAAIYALFFVYLVTAVLAIAPGALLMSAVYNLSSKFQRTVGHQRLRLSSEPTSLFVKKTLPSIPKLKCTIGRFYHMEGEAKLTLLDNIARGIAFTLLTF